MSCPQPRVSLQGSASRSVDRRPCAECADDPDRPRAPAGRVPQHPGRARRHVDRIAALGRAVPPEDRRVDGRAAGDRLADLRSAAAQADGRTRRRSCASDRPSIPRRTRTTCAAGITGTTGAPTASSVRSSTSSARSVAIPMYALAYAGLADTLGVDGLLRLHRSRGRVSARARRPRRAPSSSILTSLTRIRRWRSSLLFWDRDWAGAEREFKAAISLNPQLAIPHALYSIYLMTVGRFDEAIDEGRAGAAAGSAVAPHQHDRLLGAAFRQADRRSDRAKCDARASWRPTYQDASHHPDECVRGSRAVRGCRACRAATRCCFGVKADANQLIEAYRTGGPEAYWRKRLEVLDSARRSIGTPRLRICRDLRAAGRGRRSHRSPRAHGRYEGWRRRVHRGGSVCASGSRDHPRFKRLMERVGTPTASAPHTVST